MDGKKQELLHKLVEGKQTSSSAGLFRVAGGAGAVLMQGDDPNPGLEGNVGDMQGGLWRDTPLASSTVGK